LCRQSRNKNKGLRPLINPEYLRQKKNLSFPVGFLRDFYFLLLFPLGFSFLFASFCFSFRPKRKEKEEENNP